MKYSGSKFKLIFYPALLLIFIITTITFADVEFRDKKTFNVKSGGSLVIDSERGSIDVKSWNKEVVEVEIYKKADTFTDREAEKILEDFEINFEQSGNDVYIKARFRTRSDNFFGGNGRRLTVKYTVFVPQKYNVDLTTAGGSISVDDLAGNVKSHTSGGSLHFGEITGPVTGKTSGGSITLEGCVGDADIKTSGGSITIGLVNGRVDAHTSGGSIRIEQAKGNVIAKTSGGSIEVKEVMGDIDASTSGGSVTASISRQPQGRCSLRTSGGSVNAYIAENIKVNLDASTSGGKVYVDFPITIQGEIKRTQLVTPINGGGPELILRTSGGNVNLKKLE